MRVLLSTKERLKLLSILKQKYHVKTLKELSIKMNISFKTFNNWMYNKKKYIPENLIPADSVLKIIDRQQDNWGAVKAGKIGGKRSSDLLIKKFGKEGYSEIMRERGKKSFNSLLKKYGIKKVTQMAVEGKIRKRKRESRELEEKNSLFFIDKEVLLDLRDINYSKKDIQKGMIFPKKVTPELAEEVGIHLGDGCLSKNRNYFSVKTNKTEKEYMQYLFKLYKKLYNIDLKMMILPSVVGFEIYSKALCEYKNKVLGLPYGEKVHKIEVPKAIIDTKDKKIYQAFIRGLFDTDGCICISERNGKDYPVISLNIRSEKLIIQVSKMLKRLGYLPFNDNYHIALNGIVMFNKWTEEIGSNNSKNFDKLKRRIV